MIHSHPHPGEVLKETVFAPLNLSVDEVAARLDFPLAELAGIVAGQAPITPELALRIEKAGVSTAQFWLRLQSNYDLWRIQRQGALAVRPLQPAAI